MKGLITSKLACHARVLAAFVLALTALVSLLIVWGNRRMVVAQDLAPPQPDSSNLALSSTSQMTYYIYLPFIARPYRVYLPFISYSPIVFSDDFSSPDSGWPTGKAAGQECYFEYLNGHYQVKVEEDGERCIIPNFNIPKQVNGTFSVKVRRTSDKDRHMLYGLIFGAGTDAIENRWGLEVYPNKDPDCDDKPFYWLYALVDGDNEYFESKCTESIDRDENDWNELKVVRNGTRIDIYINGEHKGTYTDADYLLNEGYTLLEVVSVSDDNIEVEFDDFVVSRSTQLP
ncbi:MAG: hypothetical protein P8186_25760 [Anaerolineae bacterium]|jgi:hypothetical protein